MTNQTDDTSVDPFAAEVGKSKRLQEDYLRWAREALDRAKGLLANEDDAALRYAALELRHALEALVYENALRFSDELIGEDFAVWQPTRLLEQLLEIDPVADASLEMLLKDPESGEWLSLGHDRRVRLRELKKPYFALGNHLHTPSIAKMKRKGAQKPAALRKRCHECIELVERDLNATMRLGRMAIFGHFDFNCQECGTLIRRRLNALRTPTNTRRGTKDFIQAKCPNCPASYEIRADGAKAVRWRGQFWEAQCPYDDCDGEHVKWTREVKDGMVSACPDCCRNAVFIQTYSFLPEQLVKSLRGKAT